MTAAILPETDRAHSRLLETFLAMVRITSPSGGEAQMRAYLAHWADGLKLPHRTDAGGNLIIDVPAAHCAHDRVLVLSGHMDVVPPCENVQPQLNWEANGDCVIQSDESTVLGADCKSGLAPILEAVALALENDSPRPALRLLFTTREEVFLCGAKELEDASLDAAFAITFDHTGAQGTIIHEAPTYVEFKIDCKGKSVHAGIMPEQGVNAITFAAQVIEGLHLGRLDADTTANIGFWDGGKATNIVPDLSTINGELRSHNPERITEEIAHIARTLETVSASLPGTRYDWSHEVAFHGYQIPETEPAVQLISKALARTGLTPQFIRTNGGSDNNVFVHRGLPGVVLSAGYVAPHSLKERVRLSNMETCTRLLTNLMETFAHVPF